MGNGHGSTIWAAKNLFIIYNNLIIYQLSVVLNTDDTLLMRTPLFCPETNWIPYARHYKSRLVVFFTQFKYFYHEKYFWLRVQENQFKLANMVASGSQFSWPCKALGGCVYEGYLEWQIIGMTIIIDFYYQFLLPAVCGTDDTPLMGTGCVDDGNDVLHVCGQCGVLFDVCYPIGADYIEPMNN